ncbi:MAG: SDR family oxidoreductase [Acidobacteria bacterium]|nr:SDR family oxidoreductase [Acidobacteriota bacterium]
MTDKKAEKILVTGASGVVGSRVLTYLIKEGYDVIATSHKRRPPEVDIPFVRANLGDARSCFELVNKYRPDIVVHTAANSNIDLCEIYQEQSWLTNVVSVQNLIGLSLLLGFRFIYFSSEQVYGEHPDGKKGSFVESDSTRPMNFYAKSKKIAEDDILQHLDNYLIFRLSLVYGWGSEFHQNWCDHLFEDIEEGIQSRLYSDQLRTMIYVEDIAKAVQAAIEHDDVVGVYNLGGAEPINRDEFGRELARVWGFDEDLVVSVSMQDFNPETPRPMNCSLDISSVKKDLGYSPTPLKKSIEHMKANNPHPPLNPPDTEKSE